MLGVLLDGSAASLCDKVEEKEEVAHRCNHQRDHQREEEGEETHTPTQRRWLTGVITSETTRGREEKRGRWEREEEEGGNTRGETDLPAAA